MREKSFHVARADPGTLHLIFRGRLDMKSTAEVWSEAIGVVEEQKPQQLVIDAGDVDYCDGAGIGLLIELCCRQERAGRGYEIHDLRDEFRRLLELFDPADIPPMPPERKIYLHLPEELGRAACNAVDYGRGIVSFLGQLAVALARELRSPRRLRWSDILLITEKAGANALPIVALVSFLIGLIMAFQSAIPMRQFGAEIYVANLIGLSMLRELGPLMTAVILAGRSGSAFAAELGTMKVNEEIDALETMGLDPVRYLVVNRVVAGILVMPLLSVFADLVAIMGGSVVLLALGYPLSAYIHQLLGAVDWIDFSSGLFKSLFFGGIIAGIGCMSGLQTRGGPSAIGDAATRAVVTGNILIIIADGIFAVLFYYLDI